ncbi:MAG: BMP family ABC transporter substrate-binding protein [Clostridia bacterium]|nr:BMP family ABC transporter substrate-binding protein [Clostridia bacterium]
MKKYLAIALALVMVLTMVACSSTPAAEPAAEPAAPAEATEPAAEATEPAAEAAPAGPVAREAREPIAVADLKIGVILVHDENSGYDMAHIEGVKGAMANLGIKEDQAIFKYNIPADETCYDTAVDLAEQGCQIILSDSYGHQSHLMAAAAEYPNVIFVACTGDTAAMEPVANVANIFPYTFQSRYVSGVVAGMKLKELMDAGTVTDPYIGYVGAYPYAEVVSGYTAFFLGIQSIVPEAHMDVQYTNSWYDPVAEGEAANALMSKGCVIIGQHADSTGAPAAVQAAQDSGKVVYSVGYNIDMLSVAPKAALTSAQNNWVALYTPTLNNMITGEAMPADLALGYADDAVMISALGESCAEGTAEKVAEVIAALKDGSLEVFNTANFTVGGQAVTTYLALDTDGDWVGDTGEAIADGIFHESTLRSAPYFGLRIDGITELN